MGLHSPSTSGLIKLLTGHQASLRAFIVSLMPGSTDVDDVLQDTNVVLWEKLEDFEQGTNFLAWAFAIARNTVKAHWRQSKRDSSPQLNPTIIDAITATWLGSDSENPSSKQQALDHCLETLKPNERDLIDARYASSESLENQVQEIGRSAQSIRVSLFRIREKLRQCVNARMQLKEGGAL